ncbi:MAG: zinc ribbon domain-containing protein [Lachnospiraceae bacterium]|nr:zinc ribbon domain-containing protein [Lachnospiraceae bacterium]
MFDGSTKIPKLIGFWIALLCNIVIIVYTLIKNYHIRSVSDMEENIKKMQKINAESLSNAARELSSTLQSTTTVECKQCGFKMPRGKKFCSNCGSPVVMEPKVIQGYKCSKCGRKSDSKSNFCSDCGGDIISYTIATTCRNCGEKLSEGALYCSSCGTKVEEEEQ